MDEELREGTTRGTRLDAGGSPVDVELLAGRLDAALGRLDLDDLDYRTEPAGVTALEPNEPELWVPYERLRAAFARRAKDPTDEPEGIVQRAHVACSHCWCGEHHEEGR
jgi:hypothetical protein